MKRLFSSLAAGMLALATITTVSIPTPAEAGWHGGHHGWSHHGWSGHRGWGGHRGYYRHHHSGGDGLAAGLIGLGVGTVLGTALATPRYAEPAPVYAPARAHYYVQPQPVYRAGPQVVRQIDSGHVAACQSQYRSYDVRSDTFLGYDGVRHYCRL